MSFVSERYLEHPPGPQYSTRYLTRQLEIPSITIPPLSPQDLCQKPVNGYFGLRFNDCAALRLLRLGSAMSEISTMCASAEKVEVTPPITKRSFRGHRSGPTARLARGARIPPESAWHRPGLSGTSWARPAQASAGQSPDVGGYRVRLEWQRRRGINAGASTQHCVAVRGGRHAHRNFDRLLSTHCKVSQREDDFVTL